MSYQNTANHIENTPYNNSTSGIYNQSQSRTQRVPNVQEAASFPQPKSASQSDVSLNALMGQFASMSLPTSNLTPASSLNAVQPLVGSNQYFYNPADNTYLVAPAVYPTQPLGAAQANENNYGSYAATLPYFAQSAYSGYVPGLPLMPYTPNRVNSGYYPDRADLLHKEVPGLENRRGSYSTNESVPGTPHYCSFTQREQAKIATVDRSPFGSTPSPQATQPTIKPLPYKTIPVNVDIDGLLLQNPPIPRAVPAVFTPRENMRTLDQSLSNPIAGNRNVYIRGLHPNTDDATLMAYAARFGRVETSKAIIDTTTGACKGFGFAKYANVRDSELCIRGLYKLGYEVGFARESFNSRLKAEGDDGSTNLYVSNLPKNMTEAELGAIFMDYTVQSSRILRDSQNNSRGVGFARFESREICEEIIKKFHGQPIGEEGLLLQVRYADTPSQKDLKRVTTERRQFRTQEYNVGAYGATADILGLSSPNPSPVVPRAAQIARHFPNSRSSGSWKRESEEINKSPEIFKDLNCQVRVESSCDDAECNALKVITTISEDGSIDDSTTINNDSPSVAFANSKFSPTKRKS
ncbi:putative meiotic RNA-binding protein 1/putative sporulation-specific protein 5 [Blumeria hordei DH14]|uniref:Putative meiotic RNA-binding protein 1/putative sporulation-specific protein 5 n=1 Tax=Blumeria graminis f. sp. hordei (strain DH14) TaxID=546991 RepID=N1J7J5_BLUG1|nr:putative meiotic RNA-binding protein 1/putative sporulation-specific protein 5 [Blumeria hordei DH14]